MEGLFRIGIIARSVSKNPLVVLRHVWSEVKVQHNGLHVFIKHVKIIHLALTENARVIQDFTSVNCVLKISPG